MEVIYTNTLKLKFTRPSQCNFLKRNRLFEQKEASRDFFFAWEIAFFLTATKFIIDPSQFSNSPSSLPSSLYTGNQITIAHSRRHFFLCLFLIFFVPLYFYISSSHTHMFLYIFPFMSYSFS